MTHAYASLYSSLYLYISRLTPVDTGQFFHHMTQNWNWIVWAGYVPTPAVVGEAELVTLISILLGI